MIRVTPKRITTWQTFTLIKTIFRSRSCISKWRPNSIRVCQRYFNLALVLSINSDAEGAARALAKYRELVPEDEGRDAAQLLEDLKKSITTARNSRLNSA